MDAIYWHDGQWTTDNPSCSARPTMPSGWQAWCSTARAFRGLTPDLDLHCQRVVRSAEKMLMKPQLGWEAIQDLCLQAVAKFPEGTELYIKPMFYCADGFLLPDADRTQFVLHVFRCRCPANRASRPASPASRAPGPTWRPPTPRRPACTRTASAPSATRPTVASTTPSCWTATATSPSSPPATCGSPRTASSARPSTTAPS